jgi:outer membrane murein-binding lipoprotein Lpp
MKSEYNFSDSIAIPNPYPSGLQVEREENNTLTILVCFIVLICIFLGISSHVKVEALKSKINILESKVKKNRQDLNADKEAIIGNAEFTNKVKLANDELSKKVSLIEKNSKFRLDGSAYDKGIKK